MSTESKELKEVEILTPEQISALPEIVKENVLFLTENMNSKDLMVLNPIVSTLLNIKSNASKLSFVSLEDKESIDNYKSVKASLKSFNGTLKKSATTLKKDLKKPYQAVIDIEKVFKSISDETAASIKDKFSEYEADVIIKAQIALDKKNAALNAKVEEANKEAEAAVLASKKSSIYNHIKYDLISEGIINNCSQLVVNANEKVIENNIHNLSNNLNFGDLIDGINFSILDPDVQTELRNYFVTSTMSSIALLKDKLKSIQKDKELLIEKAKSEKTSVDEIKEAAVVIEKDFPRTNMPLPPGHSENKIEVFGEELVTLNNQEFIDYISKEVKKLKNLVEARLKSNGPHGVIEMLFNGLKNIG